MAQITEVYQGSVAFQDVEGVSSIGKEDRLSAVVVEKVPHPVYRSFSPTLLAGSELKRTSSINYHGFEMLSNSSSDDTTQNLTNTDGTNTRILI